MDLFNNKKMDLFNNKKMDLFSFISLKNEKALKKYITKNPEENILKEYSQMTPHQSTIDYAIECGHSLETLQWMDAQKGINRGNIESRLLEYSEYDDETILKMLLESNQSFLAIYMLENKRGFTKQGVRELFDSKRCSRHMRYWMYHNKLLQ